MNNFYKDISIQGMAVAVSSHWQSLEECVEKYGAEDGFKLDKFKKSTGVTGRWIAGEYQTASDFCYAAAAELIEKYNIDKSEIGILIFVTQTPDYFFPATACLLQHRLGLSESCMAFDINQGCAGFVYGLNAVAALLQSSNCQKALLLCGDTSAKDKTRGRDDIRTSHSSLFLFGDAGTATLLEKRKDAAPLAFSSCTDGSGYQAIINPRESWRHPWSKRPAAMDDVAVFNFAISKVPDMIKTYMQEQGTSAEEYDRLVLHQANLYIMKQVAKRSGFPFDKVSVSLDTFANTSSASIPSAIIKEFGEAHEDNAIKFLACGFGVGLSWAITDFTLTADQTLPLIHTDEYFNDGLPEE